MGCVGIRRPRVRPRFAIGTAVDAVSVSTVLAVRDLLELDTASRAVFARRLVRESLVFVVDPSE
jgi:hypothetical protein